MITTHEKRNRHALLLPMFAVGTLCSAATYILVLKMSLLPSDLAYGTPLSDTARDPFVRTRFLILSIGTTMIGYPIIYLSLRKLYLKKVIPLIFLGVLIEIVLITPIDPKAGLIGSYLVLMGSVAILYAVSFRRKTK